MVNDNVMAGIAFGGVQAGVNNMFAQQNAAISYRRQKDLMNKQNQMNMANMRSAPFQQVEGLRMAGFNPAMVNGAGTQVAPTVSQGNADMPQTIPFNAQDALTMAQIENVEANTEKVNEETRGVEQQNDIVDTANDAAVKGYLADFNREQEDLEKALKNMSPDSEEYQKTEGRIKDIEKMKARITEPEFRGALGLVKGTEAAADNADKRMKILGNYLKGAMDNSVAQKELDNGTVDALATMKKAQREKLAEDINHVKQLINESKSKEDLNYATIDEIRKRIEQIGDTILRSQLSDENYIRDNQNKWNNNLKILNDAKVDKNSELYKIVKEQADLWNNRLDNLTDTEMRKTVYDTGSRIVTGLATGGAAGAASAVFQKMLNGEKITKEDLQGLGKDNSKYGDSNIYKGGPQGELEDWARKQKDQNQGESNYKFTGPKSDNGQSSVGSQSFDYSSQTSNRRNAGTVRARDYSKSQHEYTPHRSHSW